MCQLEREADTESDIVSPSWVLTLSSQHPLLSEDLESISLLCICTAVPSQTSFGADLRFDKRRWFSLRTINTLVSYKRSQYSLAGYSNIPWPGLGDSWRYLIRPGRSRCQRSVIGKQAISRELRPLSQGGQQNMQSIDTNNKCRQVLYISQF